MKRLLYLLPVIVCLSFIQEKSTDEYLLPAKTEYQWGFVNKEGKWVIDPQFEDAYHFTEGTAAVKKYGKWGYINSNGGWVINPKFDKAKPFSEGLACAVEDGKWGFIDHNGNWHFIPKFYVVSSFSDERALIKTRDGFVFIDKAGNQLINQAFEEALPYSEGMASISLKGHKGYMDTHGNWLIVHDFDEACSFSEGMALVRQNGKYGFIDTKGNVVIHPKYEDASHFREGKAAVKEGGIWGYIDKTGNYVISPKYDMAYPFSNNSAIVKSAYRYGMVDEFGNWVVNPTYKGLGRNMLAISLDEKVEEYVRLGFAKWQVKGEFEKTENYVSRMQEENRENQISGLTHQAVLQLGAEYVDLENAFIGLYDADYEKFNVYIPGARKICLPVPISMAKEFKANQAEITFHNPDYYLSGDEFVIKTLEARFRGKTLHYNIRDDRQIRNPKLIDIRDQEMNLSIPIAEKILVKEPAYQEDIVIIGESDVDMDIPVYKYANPNTFALVIGNEDYSSYQVNLKSESNVDYAEVDARIFTEYLKKTLGVPQPNIIQLINATSGQTKQAIAKLNAITRAFDGEVNLIFYYAGHGLPHSETKEPYLIPVDVNASNLEFAIKLEDVYQKLSENNANRVTMFIDACFSGGSRKENLLATRGVRIRPKSPFVLGNLVVFSASIGDQTAHAYHEKSHGIFTYFLLKGLQQSEGRVSYGELANYINTNVRQKSVLINDTEQEPTVNVSPLFENSWRNFTFFDELSAKF